MSIFQVLSNIRHSGTDYLTGSFFEATVEEFAHLVSGGALRIIDGATSVQEASDMVAKEMADAQMKAEQAVAVQPPDTWAPSPEPETTPVSPESSAPAPEATQPVNTAIGAGDMPPDLGENNL